VRTSRRTCPAFAIAATLAVAALVTALDAGPARADPTDEEPADARIDPDYAAGRKAIEAKDWPAAIKMLSSAALRDTRNADIQNYLGYAYRNVGNLDLAFRHYERALALNPRHRGAHEYAGEAYLIAGNLQKAQEHLAKLRAICVLPCEELDDLRQAIDAYRRK